MNIFILSQDPVEAAQMQCDKHCIKMVLELYQQLGAAVIRHGASEREMPLTKSGTPLKATHVNHPCTIWCGNSKTNFDWAAQHATALYEEYNYRYGKQHFCSTGIKQLSAMSHYIPDGNLEPFAKAMPDIYKFDCAIASYRNYYFWDKRLNIKCEWKKKRSEPKWWKEMYEQTLQNDKYRQNSRMVSSGH